MGEFKKLKMPNKFKNNSYEIICLKQKVQNLEEQKKIDWDICAAEVKRMTDHNRKLIQKNSELVLEKEKLVEEMDWLRTRRNELVASYSRDTKMLSDSWKECTNFREINKELTKKNMELLKTIEALQKKNEILKSKNKKN